jgi:hypothetical protein
MRLYYTWFIILKGVVPPRGASRHTRQPTWWKSSLHVETSLWNWHWNKAIVLVKIMLCFHWMILRYFLWFGLVDQPWKLSNEGLYTQMLCMIVSKPILEDIIFGWSNHFYLDPFRKRIWFDMLPNYLFFNRKNAYSFVSFLKCIELK